ncbi:MAG: hypothetical protein PHD03_04820 [Bacilli bacterium]|nr:hypothetical protein [Bacilli bacterium]
MGMDVYTCDEETTIDLQNKFNRQNNYIKIYKNLFGLSLIVNIILIIINLIK